MRVFPIYQDIAGYIDPAALNVRKLQSELKNKSYESMVRLAASLEHLPLAGKTELGTWLLRRLKKPGETNTSWWALGRIASRVPFHGSAHNVIPADTIHAWLPQLLDSDWRKQQHIAFAAVIMTRMSGDRSRDIAEAARDEVIEKLRVSRAPQGWVEIVSRVTELDAAMSSRVFGEALPSGLTLIA